MFRVVSIKDKGGRALITENQDTLLDEILESFRRWLVISLHLKYASTENLLLKKKHGQKITLQLSC